MKSIKSFTEQTATVQDPVAVAIKVRRPSSYTAATAITAAAKELLAFAFRFIQPRVAGKRAERNALGQSEIADGPGRWIAPKAPFVLPPSYSRTVFCDVGTVWITQGDNNDFVLNAGEKLDLHPVDTLVVTAMAGPALIRYSTPHSAHSLSTERENLMAVLTLRERELVALGAAMGSNCAPCIEFHIPAAQKAGLTKEQVNEAIQIADKVRQVPAKKVFVTAQNLLAEGVGTSQGDGNQECKGAATLTEGPCRVRLQAN